MSKIIYNFGGFRLFDIREMYSNPDDREKLEKYFRRVKVLTEAEQLEILDAGGDMFPGVHSEIIDNRCVFNHGDGVRLSGVPCGLLREIFINEISGMIVAYIGTFEEDRPGRYFVVFPQSQHNANPARVAWYMLAAGISRAICEK